MNSTINILYTLKNEISNSFQIEWNTIVVTVFLLILNQMEFLLAHFFFSKKSIFYYFRIDLNVKNRKYNKIIKNIFLLSALTNSLYINTEHYTYIFTKHWNAVIFFTTLLQKIIKSDQLFLWPPLRYFCLIEYRCEHKSSF